MKRMTARYNGSCADCGEDIHKGEPILYDGRAHHVSRKACFEAHAASEAKVAELERERERQGFVAADVRESLANIIRMFDRAAESGLKWPKIRFGNEGFTIQLQRAGERSRVPGAVNVTDGGRYGANTWFGRILRDGTPDRISDDGVLAFLVDIADDPEKAARESGQRLGYCSFCLKQLTEDGSLDVGYGPVCATHWGLPHPQHSKAERELIAARKAVA